MINSNQLMQILDRIANDEETKEDINVLRQLLRAVNSQNLVQLGKYNVNISKDKGDIHIGDRIYQGADADSIKEALREVLQQQKSNRPRKEQLLLTDVRREVKARLKKSLPLKNTVLINLGKELQPDQVDCPYDDDILIGVKPNELLANKTSILEVFEQDEIQGKLLILGKPGSGKTTAILELAQNLIGLAWENPLEPIPVLVNLSSWKKVRQPISEWIIPQLAKKYPVSPNDCRQWLKEQKLLPILDGLDELESSLQQPCIEAINVFLNEERPPLHIVICSRNEEYTSNKIRLKLNGAISLQPLTNEQIQNYLTQVQHIPLWQTILKDDKLLELVRTPLFLSITILVYQEISIEKWQRLKSKEERLKYLWDSYIDRMLMRQTKHKHSNYNFSNIKQNRIWLVWLAKLLQLKDKVEFTVEELQPFETLDYNFQKIYI
ncbi:MAG: NACHT domain-containing protein, partial [Scytonema sp. PMC 1069.18]|nr:NACHT domain-containing protein [Scytonema sp. PMC 1069.18]